MGFRIRLLLAVALAVLPAAQAADTAPVNAFRALAEQATPSPTEEATAVLTAPFEDEGIVWDITAGQKVFFPDKGDPYLLLTGFVRDGFKAEFNDTAIELKDGKFNIRLPLPESVNEYSFRVYVPQVGQSSYRFAYTWKKLPPEKQFSVKIRESGKVVERATEAVAKEQLAEEWVERGPVIESHTDRFYYRQFGFSVNFAMDSTGGMISTGEIGWFPEYRFNRRWTAGAGLLLSLLKESGATGKIFPAIEYRLSLRSKITSSFEGEVLVGGQTWAGLAGFLPIVGLQLSLRRDALFGTPETLTWWNKFFFNYSVILSSSSVHIFRIGTLISI
ncbi:hypothetical protein K2X33_14310 [bacterium]|nr:hypothetical protein [bacterium]